MNVHVIFFVGIGLVGCTTFKSGSEDEWESTATEETSDSPITDGHGGLPDLTEDLDPTGCDVQESTDTAIAGATSYFYGVFNKTDSGYSGYELWLLYANETWREQGYEDCVIRWNASAYETTPSDAVAANLGLSVTLTLDQGASTCPSGPDEIGDLPPSGSVSYNIQVSGENTQWYFASGEALGSGLANDNAMNYLSPKSCRWF